MALELITPPEVEPITLTEAKAHLRVDFSDDDTLVAALIAAATAYVDGRDGILGRALIEQTWELKLDEFPCGYTTRERGIRIPLPPLREIVSIKYIDPDGALQTLAPSAYQLVASGFGPGMVCEAYGETWPATRDEPDAVRVRFTAGYAEASSDSPPVAEAGVPASVLAAMKLLIGHWYENREHVVADPRSPPAELPMGVTALLAPLRIGVLGP